MILEFLLYPGLAFILIMAFLYSGLMRKLAARMQNRMGPPVWQPLLDFLKLLGKEDIVPEQARAGFTLWPMASAAASSARPTSTSWVRARSWRLPEATLREMRASCT